MAVFCNLSDRLLPRTVQEWKLAQKLTNGIRCLWVTSLICNTSCKLPHQKFWDLQGRIVSVKKCNLKIVNIIMYSNVQNKNKQVMYWNSFIRVNNMTQCNACWAVLSEFICMHGQYYTNRLRSALLKSLETAECLVAVLSIVFLIIATKIDALCCQFR